MDPSEQRAGDRPGLDRRTLIRGAGLAMIGAGAATLAPRWWRQRAATFVARNQRYDGPLASTIAAGLQAAGVQPASLAGRRVLLKPNLVEPSREVPHMTTHPAVIVAAAEVFRRWGAEVTVGEGPGHVRDTEMALVESGVQAALDDAELPFADLNYEAVGWRANRGRASRLAGFYFPQSVLQADLVVTLPKMKTHHWAGLTAAMKNLYGVIPGIKYGWPKNVLHHHGIPQTVFDINASLPQTIAIVDGIDCMEGDGPIMGSLKRMGLLVIGSNLPAVDATVARIMGLDPARVEYLALAADRLGPVDDALIDQRGEAWHDVARPFALVEHMQRLRSQELVT